jgi:hypothetical protein
MAPKTIYGVEPRVGIGPVRLGMARDAVRAAMLAVGQSHVADTHAARDLFHRNSFQVFYDEDEIAEYIELSRSTDFLAIFQGERILELPTDDAVRFVAQFASYSTTDRELGWSYVFPALDLSLWRPVIEGDEGRSFATVGIGRVGYYANV